MQQFGQDRGPVPYRQAKSEWKHAPRSSIRAGNSRIILGTRDVETLLMLQLAFGISRGCSPTLPFGPACGGQIQMHVSTPLETSAEFKHRPLLAVVCPRQDACQCARLALIAPSMSAGCHHQAKLVAANVLEPNRLGDMFAVDFPPILGRPLVNLHRGRPWSVGGVMTSKETRSAKISDRVKHAWSPHTSFVIPQLSGKLRDSGPQADLQRKSMLSNDGSSLQMLRKLRGEASSTSNDLPMAHKPRRACRKSNAC